jgi:predicted nucleic-acid-binding Zn-ribbon protein
MCAGFGWEKCKEREYVEDLGMVGEIILKWILIKGKEYIVFMC